MALIPSNQRVPFWLKIVFRRGARRIKMARNSRSQTALNCRFDGCRRVFDWYPARMTWINRDNHMSQATVFQCVQLVAGALCVFPPISIRGDVCLESIVGKMLV